MLGFLFGKKWGNLIRTLCEEEYYSMTVISQKRKGEGQKKEKKL